MDTATTTDPAQPGAGAPAQSGVLARLRALKERQASEDETFVLPATGVVVTIPKYRDYATWQRAQRIGGQDGERSQLHYFVALCRFDGERIKANDYAELIPANDHLALSNRIYKGVDGSGAGSADPDEPAAGKV